MIYKKLFKAIGEKLSKRRTMQKYACSSLRLVTVLMLAQSILASTALAAVIYVGQGATGSNNGSSWTDAYTNLQTAITNSASGDEVWVKAGTYIPTSAPNDPNAQSGNARYYHYHLKNGVTLYGGFAGTEIALSERNITANPTILSGDDISWRVIYHDTGSPIRVDNTAIMDGFAITGTTGGGVNIRYSSATIRNCTFFNNPSNGMRLLPSGTDTYIENSTFINNSTLGYGGAIQISFANWPYPAVHISNSTFVNNSAAFGGAISNEGNGNTVMNSTFSGNSASSNGNAIYKSDRKDEPSSVTNSILWGSENQIYNSDLTATTIVTYSVVQGGYIGTENSSSDPALDPLGLQDNGGPVQTIAIQNTGSAYDTGTSTGAPANDARGVSRPQSLGYDMGAFEIEFLQLSIIVDGEGIVSSTPAGISDCRENCSAEFPQNTLVTLTATADEGYQFTGWSSGECSDASDCVITMTQPSEITATFKEVSSFIVVPLPNSKTVILDL